MTNATRLYERRMWLEKPLTYFILGAIQSIAECYPPPTDPRVKHVEHIKALLITFYHAQAQSATTGPVAFRLAANNRRCKAIFTVTCNLIPYERRVLEDALLRTEDRLART